MPESIVTAILLCGAAIASIVLVVAGKAARDAGDWNLTSAFVLAVGWLPNLPALAATWANTRSTTSDVFGNTVTVFADTETYSSSLRWVFAVAAGTALVVAAYRVAAGRGRACPAALLGLLLNLLTVAATALHQGQVLWVPQLALAAALLFCGVLEPGRGAHLGAAVYGVTLAIGSALATAVRYTQAVGPCRVEKCGPLGVLYYGVLGNENALGLSLALAVPFIQLGLRGRMRTVLTVYVAAMAWVTGSRTALVAVAVTLLVLLAVRPELDRPATARHHLIGWAVVGAGVAIGAVLPLLPLDRHRFTGRAQMWAMAQRHLDASPLLGLGRGAWNDVVARTYSAHNQWLDTRFVAGWLGLALLLGMIAVMLRSAGRQHRLTVLVVLIMPVYMGITERPWSIIGVDWMSFSLVAALLSAPARSAPAAPFPPAARLAAPRAADDAAHGPLGASSPQRVG